MKNINAHPLWFIGGTTPRLVDTVLFSAYVTRNNGIILTRRLADTLIIICFLVFLVGLRHLIRRARPVDGQCDHSTPPCSGPPR